MLSVRFNWVFVWIFVLNMVIMVLFGCVSSLRFNVLVVVVWVVVIVLLLIMYKGWLVVGLISSIVVWWVFLFSVWFLG